MRDLSKLTDAELEKELGISAIRIMQVEIPYLEYIQAKARKEVSEDAGYDVGPDHPAVLEALIEAIGEYGYAMRHCAIRQEMAKRGLL